MTEDPHGLPHAQHIDAAVISVMEAVLDRHPVGYHDDFFAQGGSSLAAALVVTELEKRLGCVVPVRLLMENPGIGDFAAKLASLASPGTPVATAG